MWTILYSNDEITKSIFHNQLCFFLKTIKMFKLLGIKISNTVQIFMCT